MADASRHILFAGGGTAGHIVPALPIVAAMLERGHRATFVVGPAPLESELLNGSGAEVVVLKTGKLRRYLSIDNLFDVFRTLAAILRCLVLVRRLRPDVVFSKGGYVALPVVVAAWVWRVPVVAHESDATSGLANRLCFPFITTLCTSFEATEEGFSGHRVHTGTPIRQDLLDGDAQRGRERLGLSGDKPLLVATGGSLGADGLNRLVRDAAPTLVAQFDVYHVCGRGKARNLDLTGYQAVEFIGEGWGDMLAAADLVVSRAGANALFELLALRKLALFVPLPAKASRGDQIDNAAWALSRGLAEVASEDELDGASLAATVSGLWAQRGLVAGALASYDAPDARGAITREIEVLLESTEVG